jgi:hypothetical protein
VEIDKKNQHILPNYKNLNSNNNDNDKLIIPTPCLPAAGEV